MYWNLLGSGRQISLASGNRIRALIAFDACTTVNTGAGPSTIKVDYDLFLYNRSTAQFLYSSQSNRDNNEGFDVVASQAGNYELWVGAPVGSVACDGTFNDKLGWAAANGVF